MARGKTNNERLTRYKNQVEMAQQWRQQEGYDDLWGRLIQLYRGKHFSSMSDEDRIAINISFATINVIFPAISVARPKILVKANEQSNDDRSLFAQAILNYWWGHYDFHAPFRRASKDYLILGHGWMKVGWKTVEGTRLMTEAELDSAYMDEVAKRDEYLAENPDMEGEVPTDDDIAASLVESMNVSMIVEDRPYMERVSPFDMFVDPNATCLDDARWIAQRLVRPLEDVRADKRYRQSARLNVTGTSISPITMDRTQRNRFQDDVQFVTIWEFYDLVTGQMCVFSDNGDYLVNPMDFPYAVGHPFSMIRNYDVPEHFYPIGDLEMLEPMQLELNATRTALMNNRKQLARKYLYRKSAFGPDGLAALRSDIDNIGVPVEDESRPFGDMVAPMPHIPLSADLYNQSEIISGDIREVSGVSEYQRGVSPQVRRTATEAAMIQDATNARSTDKLRTIESFIRDIARKQLMIAQQFLTGEQMARVTGAQGKTMWLPYTRDDIIGEYDFEVEAGSTQPLNEQQQRQDALMLANTLAPFVQMNIVDPIVLAKHIIQEGFGIRGFDKFIRADALQQLQMQAMAQQQQLMAGAAEAQGMPPGMPPGAGQDPNAQGAMGVGAPQMDPMSLLLAQQQAGQQQQAGAPQ